MSRIILDSSALLAYLNAEAGAALVERALPEAAMSTVNFAETVGRLMAHGQPIESIREMFDILGLELVDFDSGLAERTGTLLAQTHPQGLSLGDRACLALAERQGAPALTADRAWAAAAVGVEIRLIR